MTEPAALHPNLARVAASYDLVIAEFAAGRINNITAQERIEALVARDDQGARWRIDLSDGMWRREQLDGTWVRDEPPTWGLATPGGWDLSRPPDPFADPRRNITSTDSDLDRVTSPNSIRGASIRASAASATQADTPASSKMSMVKAATIAAAVAVVAAVLVTVL